MGAFCFLLVLSKLEGGQLLTQRWLLSHFRSAPRGLAICICAPPSAAASTSAAQQRGRAAGIEAPRP